MPNTPDNTDSAIALIDFLEFGSTECMTDQQVRDLIIGIFFGDVVDEVLGNDEGDG